MIDSSNSPSEPRVTLFELFSSMARRWRSVVAIVAISVTLAAIAAFTTRPVYRARVVLAPAVETATSGFSQLAQRLTGVPALVGAGQLTQGLAANEAIAILESRVFVDEFIREEGLLAPLSASSQGILSRFLGRSEPSPQEAYEFFIADICSIRQDSNTGMYVLSIDWHDRHQAAAWANSLVERLNAQARNTAIERAQKQIGYLTAELDKATMLGTREAIFRLQENEIRTAMIASAQRDYAFRVIDPAITPEAQSYRWPRRGLMMFAGAVFGLVVGALVVTAPRVRSRLP